MEKETILYSIIYSSQEAYDRIPELKDAWNLTPHKISKLGETILLDINNEDELLSGITNLQYATLSFTKDKMSIMIEPNYTGFTREIRIYLHLTVDDFTVKILLFIIHLN